MATSTMAVYENRNGISTLYSQHTGLSGDVDEVLDFPTGVWDVIDLSVLTSGDQNRVSRGMTYTDNLFNMGLHGYHISAGGGALVPLIGTSRESFYRGDGEWLMLQSWRSSGLHFERGDRLRFYGTDIDSGTGGVFDIWVAAYRLQ